MSTPTKIRTPDFQIENSFSGKICGLDEVGRGPLAGPVVASCAYIPDHVKNMPETKEIRDSKILSATKREMLYAFIMEHCIVGIAEVSPAQIDEINILQASLLAMRNALINADYSFDHALVDGNKLPELPCPASAIVKGDSKSVSIAAASIIAKVTRDRIMQEMHRQHPEYGWDKSSGYPTKAHREAIERHGITEFHRKSFAPVRKFLENGGSRKALSA